MRDAAARVEPMALDEDQRISEVVRQEQARLRNFIRGRVPDSRDAEDVLQDVFYELVEANRLLMPIEHVTGCLFRVARNRITDLFRKKRQSLGSTAVTDEDGEVLRLEDLLPSPDDGPEAIYARNVLLDELELAVEELPAGQREVFVAHELEGRSFKAMAAETGVRCGEDAPRLHLVDASAASREPFPGAPSIAAHCAHLDYYVRANHNSIVGREQTLDWPSSWRARRVGDREWAALKASLRRGYEDLKTSLSSLPGWRDDAVCDSMAILAHTAYHLGAIRQIRRLLDAVP
jgi:RNA polymerase sigma factor (sigma-70 family)